MTKNKVKEDGTIIQDNDEVGAELLKHDLLKKPNVVGYATDVGKIKNGVNTGKKCMTVFVSKKVDKSYLKKKELVPGKIDGLETDVVEIGEVVAETTPEDYKKRYQKPPSGVSWGNTSITAGTGGGVVLINGIQHLATNTHVCCENIRLDLSDQNRYCTQPGKYDGGTGNRGYTVKAIIMPEGSSVINDFGVIKPINGTKLTPATLDKGVVPRGMTTVAVGDRVWKEGRTTGFTIGDVTSLDATVSVGYGSAGTVVHRHCMIFTNMSAPGDSGSWIYKKVSEGEDITDEDKYVTAYLFAGSQTHTVGHEIQNALSAVGAELYTEDNPTPPSNELEVNVKLKPISTGATFICYGEVLDETNTRAIANCRVVIYDSSNDETYTGKTDTSGKYQITEIPCGYEYKIQFNAQGYEVKTLGLGVVSCG